MVACEIDMKLNQMVARTKIKTAEMMMMMMMMVMMMMMMSPCSDEWKGRRHWPSCESEPEPSDERLNSLAGELSSRFR